MVDSTKMEVETKLEHMCRICLKDVCYLTNIYADLGDERISFANMMSLVAYIPVQNSDGLPFQICVECVSGLEFAYGFRKKIVESFQLLLRHKTQASERPSIDNSDALVDDSASRPVKLESPEEVEIRVEPSAYKLAKKRTRLKKNQCPLCLEPLSADAVSDHLHSHYKFSQLSPPKKGDKNNTCNLCNKNFRKPSELSVHHRTHLKIHPYKCDLCDKSFPNKRYLTNHVNEHNGVKRHQCKTCGKLFNLRSSLKTHEEIHVTEIVRCALCSKSYKNSHQLKVHMKKHGEAKFKCTHAGCKKSYRTLPDMNRHIRKSHLQAKHFVCNECGKAWFTRSELELHRESHSLVKKYQCDECLKPFSTKQTLRKHVLTHLDKRPFVCEYCSLGFVQRYTYNRHQEKYCKELKKLNSN